ncbi:hypothetical protein BH09ACT11_BH09ACT11_06620 [soil metagenome]
MIESVNVGGFDRQSAVVEVHWVPHRASAEVYAFVLNGQGRILSKGGVVFSKNPVSPNRAVFVRGTGDGAVMLGGQVQMCLTSMSEDVARIRCVLGANQQGVILEDLKDIAVSVWNPVDGISDGNFELLEGGLNKCLTLGEMQRDSGGWKFVFTGEGHAVAISDLANSFGIAD